jgi:hypothetical protein
MGSPLIVSSEVFRKKIIVKNLVPYVKSPSKVTPPINYDTILSDYSVTDSPDVLIDEPSFSRNLYKNNQYGAEGGYKQVPDPTALLNSKSNEGEYGYQDANIVDEGYAATQKWRPLNAYAASNNLDAADVIASLEILQVNNGRTPNGQAYPTTFNPSTYSPVSILLSPDPTGSDGLLSQDSYIARLGAKLLKKEFEARIGREIVRNTVGRANVFNVRSGTDVLNLVTGRVPLIEPNYTITVPANPLIAATDFALRLAGSTIPVSTIPGSYFDPSINSGQPTTIQQLNNAFRKSTVGKFVTKLLGATKTGSELFLNNTGGGQKSRLFGNLNYNKYKPGYDRTIFDRLGGAIVGTNTENSNYYIGSTTSEPSRVFSPSGVLPNNSFGQELQSPVFGPSELAQLYEGPSKDIKLGANGVAYVNGGGIEGGLTWISPGTESNAGKKVGPGGKTSSTEGIQVLPSFGSTISTDKEFKDGSILDQTQRIIDSAGKSGGKKLQHVGNAIDQVSKVFNDGYKEITKGSKVIRYSGNIGQEVGAEYCRVFSKDLPYLQYNDLQKADGITTQNRKIGYSVLDNTYNLNIYPNKKTGTANSTNLVGDPDKDGHVKKYMFSLENLAWRTSSKPGFTYSDLPVCERGPNGGRIMWFPPYALTFSENNSASWKDSAFIGRPEPVYTYSNTNRTGSLTWKIVVDHPSVLNLIVNKVLNNETNKERINSMVDSFFAGCLKYDLYELAKKYPLANPNDLYIIQTELDSKQVPKEQVNWIKKDIQSGVDSTNSNTTPETQNPIIDTQGITGFLQGLGFYFYNDVPGKTETTPQPYNYYYDSYVGNKQTYIDAAAKEATTTPYKSNSQIVSTFFTTVIESNYTRVNENLVKIYNGVKANQYEKVVINLVGTTSAPATQSYNLGLSKRRDDSVKKYIRDFKPATEESTLSEMAQTNGVILSITQTEEGESSVSVKSVIGTSMMYNCGDQDSKSQASRQINTVNAMACRRVAIKNVTIVPRIQPVPTAPTPVVNTTTQYAQQITETTTTVTTETQRPRLADNISKRVLRLLLSECDYFESIKEDTPMVYDNLKDKLKFFNPAFHSTTPEGLNSRLTFLNQCLRPGETIPVVKTINGKATLQYNNAVNTAFGSPPVLVLRIGDFYNTKIIPDSLNITYENLDINPEGIGIQPMIANITMNFKFIGGSGIKDAVDRIQNALSFNYYANTEIYDDRAEVTDTESLAKMDEDFKAIYGNVPPPTLNQVQNNNGQNNGSFIGEVLTTVQGVSGTTGEISYTKFMSQVVDGTQNYFTTIFNKNKEVLAQYNEGIRQIWTLNRNYTEGVITPGSTSFEYLFGKSSQYQQNIDTIFESYQQEVSTDVDLFMSFITAPNKNFSTKVVREVRQNYSNYLTEKSNTFQNALTKIIQETTQAQQSYVQQLAKLIIITFGEDNVPISGTDGYQEKNGYVQPYYTTGDTIQDLTNNKDKIRGSLIDYYLKLGEEIKFTAGSGKELTNKMMLSNNLNFLQSAPFTSVSKNTLFDNVNFSNQYIILNQDIIDDKKYENFKTQMIGSILANPALFDNGNPKLSEEFDTYWKLTAAPAFKEENAAALDFMNHMERTELKNYLNYTEIDKTQEIKVFYSNVPSIIQNLYKTDRTNYIKSLGNTDNSTTNPKTFNDSIGGIYITKIKLN